jgi:hypothetical protein
MKRVLMINNGSLVGGELMRDILVVFPEIESSFEQRKQFDEFWFRGADVELTVEKIQQLNDMFMRVSIDSEDVMIEG